MDFSFQYEICALGGSALRQVNLVRSRIVFGKINARSWFFYAQLTEAGASERPSGTEGVSSTHKYKELWTLKKYT